MDRFLGRGLSFPLRPSSAGRLEVIDGPEKVEQSIRSILDTEPGERLMRPTFGCGLRRYLMQPNTVATRAKIQRDIARALGEWEPRIELGEVSVEAGDDPAMVVIGVSYVHRRTRTAGNLIYPFYLE